MLTAAQARLLTVELHDVSPATWTEVELIQLALARVGVTQLTLLVVPRYLDSRGKYWDLRHSPELVDWLREQQDRGSELVLHGLTHRADGPPLGVRNKLMHRYFSRGCAEFAHLTQDQATWRLRQGRRVLQQCGLTAPGFIAPAWQQSPGSIAAVDRLGFSFTAFLNHVQPLVGDRLPVITPALTFDAPNPLVDHGKRLVMRCLEASARSRRLLRVALHPADVHGTQPLTHIVKRVQALLQHRQQVTYARWLERRDPRPTREAA